MTRRPAALVTLATAAALLLGTAGPAAAEPTVTIASPEAGKVVDDPNEVVAGTARTDPLHTVVSVRVAVTHRSTGQTRSCDAPVTADGGFSCSPGLRLNGPYDVGVTATDALLVDLGSRRTSPAATGGFKVEVPPAPPRNVEVDVGADRRVTISWARNTEADLAGYQVARLAPGSSSATVVDSVPQPSSGSRVSAIDGAVPPGGGIYRYVVTAVRPDRDGEVTNRAIARSSPEGAELAAAPGDPSAPSGTGGVGPGPGPGAAPSSTVAGGPRGALDVSSFLSRTGGAPPSLAVPGGVALPIDNGFSDVPFAVPGGEIDEGSDSSDPAVLGATESAANERALFVPIAAGLLLCVLAFHLRQFNRTVLSAPAAYHPIVVSDDHEDDRADPDADDEEDERPRARTAVLVGARRPSREG